ncbi:MAG: hypothetical protein H6574_15015 [Lewinellaceae bacterium]|nr:hypothetical protein [Saprospiraceae bacterium]MCB9315270.1 hypothetical protein [Lewinellaceae bacterium]MCB9332390.1 hypothetical protein [Lewinellaceae bacterium]
MAYVIGLAVSIAEKDSFHITTPPQQPCHILRLKQKRLDIPRRGVGVNLIYNGYHHFA